VTSKSATCLSASIGFSNGPSRQAYFRNHKTRDPGFGRGLEDARCGGSHQMFGMMCQLMPNFACWTCRVF
jgi:hypothetical protein